MVNRSNRPKKRRIGSLSNVTQKVRLADILSNERKKTSLLLRSIEIIVKEKMKRKGITFEEKILTDREKASMLVQADKIRLLTDGLVKEVKIYVQDTNKEHVNMLLCSRFQENTGTAYITSTTTENELSAQVIIAIFNAFCQPGDGKYKREQTFVYQTPQARNREDVAVNVAIIDWGSDDDDDNDNGEKFNLDDWGDSEDEWFMISGKKSDDSFDRDSDDEDDDANNEKMDEHEDEYEIL